MKKQYCLYVAAQKPSNNQFGQFRHLNASMLKLVWQDPENKYIDHEPTAERKANNVRNFSECSIVLSAQLGGDGDTSDVCRRSFYGYKTKLEVTDSWQTDWAIRAYIRAKKMNIHVETFAEYVCNFATAVGIKFIAFKDGDDSSFYSDQKFSIVPLAQGIAQLAALESAEIADYNNEGKRK